MSQRGWVRDGQEQEPHRSSGKDKDPAGQQRDAGRGRGICLCSHKVSLPCRDTAAAHCPAWQGKENISGTHTCLEREGSGHSLWEVVGWEKGDRQSSPSSPAHKSQPHSAAASRLPGIRTHRRQPEVSTARPYITQLSGTSEGLRDGAGFVGWGRGEFLCRANPFLASRTSSCTSPPSGAAPRTDATSPLLSASAPAFSASSQRSVAQLSGTSGDERRESRACHAAERPSLQLSSPAHAGEMEPAQEGAARAWCSPCEAGADAGAVPLPGETS